MRVTDMFQEKTVFSFEIFPPKKTGAPIESVYTMLDELADIRPDFISVTYGTSGAADTSMATVDIASYIKERSNVEGVAHLPCVNLTREDAFALIDDLEARGIDNVLALRGDVVPGREPKHDFEHANDLVSFLRENGDFDIIGACYPEGHPQAESLNDDIRHLKRKVDAGTNHLITQLFFDNETFYRYRDLLDLAGINVPVEAGIMPVTNAKQIARMVTLCGATLPHKFTSIMERFGGDPRAMMDAGIAYAVNQIVDLVAHGVDGIHLYCMNNPYVARRVYEATESLIHHDPANDVNVEEG